MIQLKNLNLFFILLLLGITGCSDVRLDPAEYRSYESTGIQSKVCTTNSNEIRNNLKFIFIIDRSGSNQVRYNLPDLTPLPGTDQNGSRRFDAILDFLDDYEQDEHIFYSLINFNNDVLGNSQDFTNDKNAFRNYVQSQKDNTASIDGLGTSYLDSLGRARDMIRDDAIAAESVPDDQEKISSNYIIFFVSDGAPYRQGVLQSDASIFSRIQSINDLEDMELVEGVQINTAYYYTPESFDIGDRDRMQEMARRGRGNALEFGGNQNIDFSQFDTSSKVVKFEYKQIWIVNLNTVWEENVLKRDTDGDGLSDSKEALLGSDPLSTDTDKNGVSDFVEYKLSGDTKACFHSDCSMNNHLYFVCRNIVKEGNAYTYIDTDKDYLNDCEEQLLGSKPNDADSNDDYIPDRLALTHGIKYIQSSNSAYLDPDNDGYTNYQELQMNTPLRTDNATVPGLRILTYQVQLLSSNQQQDCYNFSFQELTRREQDDEIRIYFMENTRAGDEKRLVRSATKRLHGGSIIFAPEEFR
ncbi:MAG: hypothetical protein KDD61_13855 [Bdellovibrionales bacterium]|nr:hypothetical protein [Bdellovibrionales bacterium]